MAKFSPVAVMLSGVLAATPTLAQQAVTAPERPSLLECGGQYECVVSRPLTLLQTQRTRGYPQPTDQRESPSTSPDAASQVPAETALVESSWWRWPSLVDF